MVLRQRFLNVFSSADKIPQIQRWSQGRSQSISGFDEQPPSAAAFIQGIPRGKNTWLQ